jgi:predicted amino acid-binding ACT domain protein
MQTKEIKMTNIQVTFTQDGITMGTIQLNAGMATLIDITDINVVCQTFRTNFNAMGEPLDFKIEYTSEDV